MSSADKPNKGNFAVDISDDAIEEALRAVERLETPDGEIELLVEGLDDTAPGYELVVEEPPAEARPVGEPLMEEPRPDPLEEARAAAAALVGENARLRAQLESLAADLESLRRRSERELEEAKRFSIEKLLLELIPVLDNLDRAQAHAKQAADVASLAQGVEMTRRLFEETLRKFGVQSFSALGQPFDPEFHEAMQTVTSADHPPSTVVEEMVRGYLLHDRLVRPAMVCVSMPPDGSDGAAD